MRFNINSIFPRIEVGFAFAPLIILLSPLFIGFIITVGMAFGMVPGHALTINLATIYIEFWNYPGIFMATIRSLYLGGASALISLFIASLILFAIIQNQGKRGWQQLLLTPLLASPPLTIALSLLFLLGPTSWIFGLFMPNSPYPIGFAPDGFGLSYLLALIFKEVPFLVFMGMAALPSLRPLQQLSLLASLGYSPFKGFILVIFPLLYRQMRLPFWIVICFSLSNVEMARILNASTIPTLPLLILRFSEDANLDRQIWAALAAILLAMVSLFALLLLNSFEKIGNFVQKGLLRPSSKRSSMAIPVKIMINSASLLMVFPLLGLGLGLLWSFTKSWHWPDLLPSLYQANNYSKAFDQAHGAILNSIGLALFSASLSLMLIIFMLELGTKLSPKLEKFRLGLVLLPLIIPEITLLFGVQIFTIWLKVQGDFWVVLWGHMFYCLPYLYLILAPSWAKLDPHYRHSASCLGLGRGRQLFGIVLPILSRQLMLGWAVAFAVSMGLYLPTLMLGAGRIPSLTLVTTALASSADWRIIASLGVMETIIPLLVFMIISLYLGIRWRNYQDMQVNRNL